MEIVVIKNNLKEGLVVASRAQGENVNLPVLKYALFEAEENKIKITATNLEIAITCTVLGRVIQKGRGGVPINTLLGLLSNIQTERVSLGKKAGNLEVKTDNYEAQISTIPTEDFPLIPKIKSKEKFLELGGGVIKDALNQVVIAAQFSEIKPELGSILFDFSLDVLKLAATDSFRLAEKTIGATQFKSNYQDSFRILVPLKTCHELLRVLEDDEVVRCYHDQNQVLFTTDRFEFISRLVEGNFPDYAAVVPEKFDAEVAVNREKLVNALKLTSIFGGRTNEVRVRVDEADKKAMEVSSASQELGKNRYLLLVKANKGFAEVGFNGHYLLEALKVLKTEEVVLRVNEEDRRPTLIKSPNEASYFYILMPLLKA